MGRVGRRTRPELPKCFFFFFFADNCRLSLVFFWQRPRRRRPDSRRLPRPACRLRVFQSDFPYRVIFVYYYYFFFFFCSIPPSAITATRVLPGQNARPRGPNICKINIIENPRTYRVFRATRNTRYLNIYIYIYLTIVFQLCRKPLRHGEIRCGNLPYSQKSEIRPNSHFFTTGFGLVTTRN